MLFVLFRAGERRYALAAASVAEVVPLVRLTPLPRAPASVRGVFRWRGTVVPAVDLAVLAGGSPARDLLSTRILLTLVSGPGGPRFVGLVAEGVTGTLLQPDGPSHATGLSLPDAPWLSGVLPDGDGVVPCVEPSRIVPPGVLEMLDAQASPGSGAKGGA